MSLGDVLKDIKGVEWIWVAKAAWRSRDLACDVFQRFAWNSKAKRSCWQTNCGGAHVAVLTSDFEQALLSSEDEYVTEWWVYEQAFVLKKKNEKQFASICKFCKHIPFLEESMSLFVSENSKVSSQMWGHRSTRSWGTTWLFPFVSIVLELFSWKKNKAELARIRVLEREQIAPHPAPENKNRSHLKTLDMLDRFAVNMKGFQRCRSSIWDFGLRGLRGINQKQGGASRGGHLSVTACALDARWCCLPCMPMETWDRPCWRWRQSLLSERRGCANELTSELCCSLEAIYSWIMLDHVGLVWYVPAHGLFNLSNADCGCSMLFLWRETPVTFQKLPHRSRWIVTRWGERLAADRLRAKAIWTVTASQNWPKWDWRS